MNHKYKTIIFDFDGTLASSVDEFISITKSLFKKHKLKELTDVDIAKVRNSTPSDAIKIIGVPLWKLLLVLQEGRSKFRDDIDKLKPVAGIENALDKLKKKYHLGILTSNKKNIVEEFTKKNSLDQFDWIVSENNIFGKHNSLKKIIKKNNLKIKECIYIGDEVRDIQSCKKISIDCIAVTWGLNYAEILKSTKPTYIANTVEELLKIFE